MVRVGLVGRLGDDEGGEEGAVGPADASRPGRERLPGRCDGGVGAVPRGIIGYVIYLRCVAV